MGSEAERERALHQQRANYAPVTLCQSLMPNSLRRYFMYIMPPPQCASFRSRWATMIGYYCPSLEATVPSYGWIRQLEPRISSLSGSPKLNQSVTSAPRLTYCFSVSRPQGTPQALYRVPRNKSGAPIISIGQSVLHILAVAVKLLATSSIYQRPFVSPT